MARSLYNRLNLNEASRILALVESNSVLQVLPISTNRALFTLVPAMVVILERNSVLNSSCILPKRSLPPPLAVSYRFDEPGPSRRIAQARMLYGPPAKNALK